MKNVRKIVSNGLIIGGLLTSAGSLVDNALNTAFRRESQARAKALFEIDRKYRVGIECTPGGASSVCGTVVYGRHTEEERRAILRAHNAELSVRLSAIPTNQAARARAERDGLGMVVGLGLIAGGVELRRGRQFRNSIESRKGGRKEDM